MKNCSKCGDLLLKKAFNKDTSRKSGLSYWCRKCEHAQGKKYALNNVDRTRKCHKEYQAGRKPLQKLLMHEWYLLNKSYVRAKTRKYQIAKLNRTPKWLTPKEEQKIIDTYINCPKGMVVDHIIPLQGKYISGFHHPDNLQYLTPGENSKKRNRYLVEGRE